jgi:DNA-directed RNA polymerase specialized sigma24 family protein
MSDADGPTIDALLADSEWVRDLARSLVGGARADDVVQDVWLSALERGPRSAAAARGWLGTVLRNSVWSMHRADARRTAREAEAARRDEPASTLEVVERFSTQQAVAAAVLELPAAVRDAILLRYYEDVPVGARHGGGRGTLRPPPSARRARSRARGGGARDRARRA